MKLINMIKFHIKRICKTPSILFALLMVPLMGLAGIWMGRQGGNNAPDSIQIVLEANNDELTSALTKAGYEDNISASINEALSILDQGRTAVVYHIPSDYVKSLEESKAVAIQLFSREEGSRDRTFESNLQSTLKELMMQRALVATGVIASAEAYQPVVNETVMMEQAVSDNQLQVMLFGGMLATFIVFNATVLAADLISFKKNNALRRAVVTPNTNLSIAMGFIIAYAVMLLLIYGAVVVSTIFVFNFTLQQALLLWIVIGLAILINLSLSLIYFRVFKEPGMVSSIGALVGMGMAGLAFLGVTNEVSIPFLINISYISPLTWLFEILDSGQLFPAVPIVLLMVTLFAVSGSFKLNNRVQK